LISGDYTVVVEFSAGNPGFGGHRLFFFEAHNAGFTLFGLVTLEVFFRTATGVDENDAADQRTVEDLDNDYSNGTNRMAFTRTDTHIALSINGNAVLSDDTFSGTITNLDTVRLASANAATSGAFIRKMWIYNPVSDTELPGLSS